MMLSESISARLRAATLRGHAFLAVESARRRPLVTPPSAGRFLTFPIVIYPTFEMVEAALVERGQLLPPEAEVDPWVRNGYRSPPLEARALEPESLQPLSPRPRR